MPVVVLVAPVQMRFGSASWHETQSQGTGLGGIEYPGAHIEVPLHDCLLREVKTVAVATADNRYFECYGGDEADARRSQAAVMRNEHRRCCNPVAVAIEQQSFRFFFNVAGQQQRMFTGLILSTHELLLPFKAFSPER